jgi:RNA polymerase sigma factor for flagellar operon FliA
MVSIVIPTWNKVELTQNCVDSIRAFTPEKHEIATDMGLTVAELEDWETQFGASQIKSLDEVYTDHSMLFSDAARSV